MKEYIENVGMQVSVVNLARCKSWDAVVDEIRSLMPIAFAGITCYTRQRFSCARLASIIKDITPQTLVCFGGPHATYLDSALLDHISSVDFVIRGEGELALADLLNILAQGATVESLATVPGLTFRSGTQIFRNPRRSKKLDLQLFAPPVVPMSELGLTSAAESLRFHFPTLSNDPNARIAPVISSRGCDGNCTFCCNSAFWGKQRYHTSDHVLSQVRYYYDQGVRLFDFYDDDFPRNKVNVLEFSEMISAEGMEIAWWCSSRVDSVDEETLIAMKRAGCFMVSYGIESGSQQILNRMNKRVTIDRIRDACRLTRRAGLGVRATLSIGHIGESWSTIEETNALLADIRPDQIAIFVLKVYPGTPIHHMMVRAGRLDDEYWFDEDQLIVPYFTLERSGEELLALKNHLVHSLAAYTVRKYEYEVSSTELDLNWESVR
ncbi:MAG: B12-binding domain-containing radical SAM protein [Micrococcales bacterium]|nr:B12-binding domain-containing radical SAM protein [Micrococcales bacterium]